MTLFPHCIYFCSLLSFIPPARWRPGWSGRIEGEWIRQLKTEVNLVLFFSLKCQLSMRKSLDVKSVRLKPCEWDSDPWMYRVQLLTSTNTVWWLLYVWSLNIVTIHLFFKCQSVLISVHVDIYNVYRTWTN